jgi:type IV secretory pathway TraG/TraD family ATPase VirD4
LTWIDDVYGKSKRNGILSVCAHKIFFAANDLETAGYVSEMCGEKTVQTVSTTRNSSSRFGSSTKNTSMRTWPLITKDQVTRLSRKTQIILAEASFPIKCQKIAYNRGADAKIFGPRLMAPPFIPTLHIERYSIPKFNIPKNDNQEEASDPNQGDLLTKTDDQTPEDNSSKEDNNQTDKKDGKNKDNPEAGLFFDKDDE